MTGLLFVSGVVVVIAAALYIIYRILKTETK